MSFGITKCTLYDPSNTSSKRLWYIFKGKKGKFGLMGSQCVSPYFFETNFCNTIANNYNSTKDFQREDDKNVECQCI